MRDDDDDKDQVGQFLLRLDKQLAKTEQANEINLYLPKQQSTS
jgi:hypothetical protein